MNVGVYLITSPFLANIIIKRPEEGVRIRVFTNKDNTGDGTALAEAQIERFHRKGSSRKHFATCQRVVTRSNLLPADEEQTARVSRLASTTDAFLKFQTKPNLDETEA
ncbi:uncharacterized protein LOC111618514 isoform X2 [Centruroides sculpturatus]|uniref:uncharacterized protein LOC111618514 isoform X2 n=1 Tax=Centruroides sculpturatus TaxID=218467 RepID=UPI000C6CF505|nr:uncharacterized protein LOC111618514 isoform X2 [Centruroides sculpturatus]